MSKDLITGHINPDGSREGDWVASTMSNLDTSKLRLPIRRCRRCQSWLGVIAAHEHECHRDDTVIDAILTEYAATLTGEGAPR